MNIILKSARIIDNNSTLNNQIVDIAIFEGKIKQIAPNIEANSLFNEINLENLHVSSGWFDSSVCLGEPGFEDRETIANGLQVAAKSGFTTIALQPNTNPVICNQATIELVKQKSNGFATQLLPIGAFTQNSDGVDLAELFDMKKAGAIAFGDYNKNIQNANLLKLGLQYVADFDGLVIAYSQNNDLKGKGIVNEGEISTKLGLKGIPALAEEIQINTNLQILEYTGGKLHIPTVTSANSVELIKNAKAKGLQVTCSVAVHNLVLNDSVLESFDSRFKVTPPLRTETDRLALIEGVLNNTIDCITSDHNPISIEDKKMEFDLAKNGTIGLESAFGSLLTILPLEIVIEKLQFAYTLFNLLKPTIAENEIANLSLFNPDENWVFTKNDILSKSKNSAFLNQKLKGKTYGIYNNNTLVLK